MSRAHHITVVDPARLDRVVQSLTGLSRAGVRGLLDHHCVRINGTLCTTANAMLTAGNVVEVRHNPHTHYREKPSVRHDPAFRLLFEDEHVIVVDKAAHVLTVPTDRRKGTSLMDALQRHVDRAPRRRGSRAGDRSLHVIQRLDRGVSGVMVVARTAAAAASLRTQFALHKPERLYVAIVNGEIRPAHGTFRSHLATDRALNRYSTGDPEDGERAVTHYEVQSCSRGVSVVRVKLETGQRNQIRVHFAEAGHPVLGDPRYPRAINHPKTDATVITSAHPKWKARRMALHAWSLSFEHPGSRTVVRFEADLPDAFLPFMPQRAAARERIPKRIRE